MYSALINWTLPILLHMTRSRYWTLAREIRNRQYWPKERLANWHDESLRRLVTHAFDNVPFYHDRARECGISSKEIQTIADLTLIPPTTKEDIQRHFPDRMTARARGDSDWRMIGTRGTTNRLMVIHDFVRRDHARATALVVLTEDCGYRVGMPQVAIPPDACSAVCGLEGMRNASVLRHVLRMIRSGRMSGEEEIRDLRGLVMNNWIERVTILDPLYDSDGLYQADDRLRECVRRIREVRPQLLIALPEYLRALARYARRSDETLPALPLVRPMGANLDAVTRSEIESCLHTRVREHYGSLELGGIAFECRAQAGLHILADQYAVEIVRNGRRIDPGKRGSVLITDLHNTTMPLIRYQIGDVGWMEFEPCTCGRTSPRIHLEGRVEDTIVASNDKLVTPEAASCALLANQSLDDFQLIESRIGAYELRYAVGKESTVCHQELEKTCRQLLGGEAKIQLRSVREIAPEPSGKFRHIKSASYRFLIDALSRTEVV